jgi:hypothetical protein
MFSYSRNKTGSGKPHSKLYNLTSGILCCLLSLASQDGQKPWLTDILSSLVQPWCLRTCILEVPSLNLNQTQAIVRFVIDPLSPTRQVLQYYFA